MKTNREFAEKVGMTENQIIAADEAYSIISMILEHYEAVCDTQEQAVDILHGLEYFLQHLFGLPLDRDKHKYVKQFQFKQQWAGRKWKCNTTGEVFTIPNDVYETAFYSFGNAFVDVGRLNAYCRFSNCTEIVED